MATGGMEFLFQKLFGLGPKTPSSLDKTGYRESKKTSRKLSRTSADRSVWNASQLQGFQSKRVSRDSARSLLCYTLNKEELDLQSKHAKKYNKRKLYRVSANSTSEGGSLNGRLGQRKPAALIISRRDPSFFSKPDKCETGGKTFAKFIPIENFESPTYKLSELDRRFPLCWFDIQTWYRETRRQHQEKADESKKEGVRNSLSDTAVYHSPSRKVKSGTSICELLHNSYQTPKTIQDIADDCRFGIDANKAYFEVTCSKSPNYIIELLLQLPGKEDVSLCHLKTELIVFCLQRFFFPTAGIHVMWVQDVKSQAMRLCSIRGLQRHLPIPPQSASEHEATNDHLDKSFQEMQALMILSPDAAVLIKHSELCFLETLAAVADILPDKFIVFQQTRKSCQLTVIHEIP